jgi:hypothetical protein
VKNPFSSNDLPETMRRRVELAVAVAQERLLSTHVDHALRLIQLVGDQASFAGTLGIYTRMLRLSDDESRVITTRAMAILGEQVIESRDGGGAWNDAATEPVAAEDDGSSRSFLRSMRQRLRGRVREDLRRWVELAAARTEVAILDTHVENAANFVDLLEQEQAASESVELYLDALEVRESVAEITYYMVLSRIADRELPELSREHRAERGDPAASREAPATTRASSQPAG